ncbi:MAG: YiiX/YebB-like N1pC/P60 family cysteine hydrolase [bacterium]
MKETKMVLLDKIFRRFRDAFLKRLNLETQKYEQRIYNNFDNLFKHIRKGDIILVEGRSQISRIIKLFSQSHWSHIAIYVGDELIKKNRFDKNKFLQAHGEQAKQLVVEALSGEGVLAAPLDKYCGHNIRVCRPFGIHRKDMQAVIEDIISNLGKKYDQQNIIDIALMLLPKWLNPLKKRSLKACLGNCNDFQVICSGMIARAFQRVGYPIVPALGAAENDSKTLRKNPYGAKLRMRHFSQILPRDFDLSPNFEVIKFNIIKGGKFKYKELPWEEGDLANHHLLPSRASLIHSSTDFTSSEID